jgi:hypothetical protein
MKALVLKIFVRVVLPVVSFWVGGVVLMATMIHSITGDIYARANVMYDILAWPALVVEYWLS